MKEERTTSLMDYSILKSHIKDIQKAAKEDNLVVFVGAGVSNNSGVPVWNKLTEAFKSELPEFAKNISDDLKLAQIYKTTYPSKFLETVRTVLKDGEIVPNAIHNAILDLKPCHIITTNYDDLIEQACKGRFELYQTVSSDDDMVSIPNTHIIVKMHGEYGKGNIVLAEEDYYDYSRNFPLLRAFVLSLLASKTVLFIGFSFNDINLKYILREIQTVLCRKMRPVYMLTDTTYSYEQIRYLEEKCICPICMDEKTIEVFLTSCEAVESCPDSITNCHGKNLFNQLRVINHFEEEPDLLRRLMACVEKYDNELPVLGDFLLCVLPEDARKYFKRDAYSLRIDEKYLESIIGKITTKFAIRDFLRRYNDIYGKLKELCYKNSIYYINRTAIISNAYFRKKQQTLECDALDLLYRCDYVGVTQRVKSLNGVPCTLSSKDLELPFVLSRMGKHEMAFESFCSLASMYWENRKYILYVICRINMLNLSSIIVMSPNSIIGNKARQISEVSIHDVLRDTPLDSCIRTIFEELVSYRMLIKKESYTRKLREKIEEQKENAKNGGCAWNNHSIELRYDFSSIIDFCMGNYIMMDNSSYANGAFRNIASGLMDSLLIPGDNNRNSKIKAFIPEMLLLMVNHIANEDLAQIMAKCGNRTLEVDANAKSLLKSMTRNIHQSLTDKRYLINDYFSSELFSKMIRNISELLCRLPDDCMPDVDWYEVIANHIRIGGEKAYERMLPILIEKHKPSYAAAEKLIQIFLNPWGKYAANPDLIEMLVKIIKEEDKQYSLLEPWDNYRNVDYCCLAVLYPILPVEKQSSLIDYLKNHVDSLVEAVAIEISTPCKILDEAMFERLLCSMNDANNPFLKKQTMCWLKRLYFTKGYEKYQPMIGDLAEKEPFMKFVLAPMGNLQEMQEDWILWLDDNELRNVIGNEELMTRIGEYCKRVYDNVSKEIKRRIWEVITTNNKESQI